MKLTAAMLHIRHYFDPMVVHMQLVSPTSMDLKLSDPATGEAVDLRGIPYRRSMTAAELYQLINLIEGRAQARNFELFSAHAVNKLQG